MIETDWFAKALEHHEDGNYSQAIIAIRKYVEANPNNKAGKLLEAVIYGDLHNYDKVLKILNDLELNADDEEKLFELYYTEFGDTYNEMGNYQEAIKWYDKLIELMPNRTKGCILKGACFATAGKYELAIQEHLKATQLEGDPEEAYYNLALINRAEMKFEQAKKYCEKSLAIDPEGEEVKHCYKDILEALKLKKI
ncbi:tetratricopeptide repeat protein [bacterium]|nr:tetratricopeptide repeat protein [bacterium]